MSQFWFFWFENPGNVRLAVNAIAPFVDSFSHVHCGLRLRLFFVALVCFYGSYSFSSCFMLNLHCFSSWSLSGIWRFIPKLSKSHDCHDCRITLRITTFYHFDLWPSWLFTSSIKTVLTQGAESQRLGPLGAGTPDSRGPCPGDTQ